MRIERIELDGFGRFHDARWELDEGLTVVLGANEAGKTTLLNGLRALLFGFESSRDGRTWYPPLAGGRRGGRLVLRTSNDERWTVERHGERGGGGALAVRAPSGNQGGQETLDRLLHGADRDLFNNIFAFGLGELQSFSTLSTDGVRGRIYGAGAGLGGTSAVDLERRLRQSLDGAFLPRGSQRPLNVLLGRIEELHAEIAQLASQPAEYEAAHHERDELRGRAARLRADALTWRERALRSRHVRDAGPLAAMLVQLESELATGDPELDRLPPDALEVHDRRAAELRQLHAMVGAIDEEIDAARSQREALNVDERLLAEADAIAAIRDERAARAGAAERRRELEASLARHAAAAHDLRERAGGWAEERLMALDDSITAVEATRQLEGRLQRAAAASAAARDRHLAAREDLRGREAELSTTGEAGEDVERRAAAVRRLGSLLAERRSAEGRAAPWAMPVSALLAVAALIAGAGAGAAVGQVAVGAAIGLLAGAIAAWVLRRWSARSSAVQVRRMEVERSRLLADAGLPEPAGEDEVSALGEQLAVARARRELERDRRADLDARRQALVRLEAEAAGAGRALAEAEAAWGMWLAARGIPTDASPEAARQLLGLAGAARRTVAERDQQRALIDAECRAEEAFIARVDGLFARLGVDPVGDAMERHTRVAGLADRLDRARTDQRRRAELDATIRRLAERRAPMARAAAGAEAALMAHLARVGCADEDELRRRHAAAAERRDLRGRLREVRAQLTGIAGTAEAVPGLVEEARAADPAALEAAGLEAAAQADRLEEEERQALNRIGALDARIRQLEAASELGAKRQELAVLEGRAAAMARDWAVRAMTLRLLEETRARYEHERQPDVVRAAESHFDRITGGRYSRIVAPPGDASVRVETEGGESRGTDELSRGTAEQLYLALRFGLIEEFARQAEALPVVMDDILVNFDGDRAARSAAAIRDLAARHQVLYFTCHEPTATLLDPDGGRTLALG